MFSTDLLRWHDGRRCYAQARRKEIPCSSFEAWRSRPDEIRVLGFQPIAAPPAAIEAALALRHDAFQVELARLGEHDRALGGERFAEQNPINAGDEPPERSRRASSGLRRRSSPSRRTRSKAISVASAPPRLVRSAPKSLRPSFRRTTASPSMSAWSAGRPRTASAIVGKRKVKSAPRRLQTWTRSLCLRARSVRDRDGLSQTRLGIYPYFRHPRTNRATM